MSELETVDSDYFQLLSHFYFLFLLSFNYLFWNLVLRVIVTSRITVIVTKLCDQEKDVEGSKTNNVIQ